MSEDLPDRGSEPATRREVAELARAVTALALAFRGSTLSIGSDPESQEFEKQLRELARTATTDALRIAKELSGFTGDIT